MNWKVIVFILLFPTGLCFSQKRLILNNDPYIVINGGTVAKPINLVIDNSSANAITLITPQISGGIKSENEFNIVKWNVGISTGNYTVPFTRTGGGPIIPFSINITTAGVGAGNIKFSTYPGATWDNATYMPTGVTNMSSTIGGPNNSASVVDRFWSIDANGFTTQPDGTASFTYVDGEWAAAGNTITEANLGAQGFNTASADWQTIAGVVNTIANTVTAVPFTSSGFYKAWTLSDNTSPLPIELTNFTTTFCPVVAAPVFLIGTKKSIFILLLSGTTKAYSLAMVIIPT